MLILLLLLVILMAGGCNSSSNITDCSYTIFTFPKDDFRFRDKTNIIHEHPLFSFEYPQCFGWANVNDVFNSDVTVLSFHRNGNSQRESSSIYVTVQRMGYDNEVDAKSVVENLISSVKEKKDFKIIDRKSIDIDNLAADYVSFYYFVPKQEGVEISYSNFGILAAFDYKGFIWKIRMGCPEKESQEITQYYEHLRKTFKILD